MMTAPMNQPITLKYLTSFAAVVLLVGWMKSFAAKKLRYYPNAYLQGW